MKTECSTGFWSTEKNIHHYKNPGRIQVERRNTSLSLRWSIIYLRSFPPPSLMSLRISTHILKMWMQKDMRM
jgi:hypothetical protein